MTSRNLCDRTMLAPMQLADGLTPAANHAAVCAVLRAAARAKAPLKDVDMVCAALGLDPAAALQEARRR